MTATKLIEITPETLPDFGVRVLITTVRETPLPTEVIYDAYRKAKFSDADRNMFLSSILAGNGEHPAKVAQVLDALPREYTRSALVEARRIKKEEREQGQHFQNGEAWAWVCDALPLRDDFDLLPTHFLPLGDVEV